MTDSFSASCPADPGVTTWWWRSLAIALGAVCLIPQPAVAMACGSVWAVHAALILVMLALLVWGAREGFRLVWLLAVVLVVACLRADALAYEAGLFLGGCIFILMSQRGPCEGLPVRTLLVAVSAFSVWATVAIGLWYLDEISPAMEAGVPFTGWPRFVSPLGHANYTSGLGLLFTPVLAALAWRWRSSWRAIPVCVALVLAFVCLVGGGSRAALAAMGLTVVLTAVAVAIRFRRHGKWALASLPVGLAVGLAHPSIWVWLQDPARRVGSDLLRWDYVSAAWRLFLENPWTGTPDVPLALMAHRPAVAEHYSCYQVHSTPFQWACEFGIAGWLLYGTLVVLVVRALWREIGATSACPVRVGAGLSLAAYLLFAWFDYQLNLPCVAVPFFAMLAWLTRPSADTKVREAGSARLRVIIVVVVALVFVLGLAPEAVQRYHLRNASQVKPLGTGRLLESLAHAPAVSDNPVVDALIGAYAMNALPENEADRAILSGIADKAWERACGSPFALPQFPVYRAALYATSDRPKALVYLRDAVHRFPKQLAAWVLMAQVLESEGRSESALRARAVAALISPGTFYAHVLRHADSPGQSRRLLECARDLVARHGVLYPNDKYSMARADRVLADMTLWLDCGGSVRAFYARKAARGESLNPSLDPALSSDVLARRIGSMLRHGLGLAPGDKELRQLVADWRGESPVDSGARERRLSSFKAELPTFGLFVHQGDHPVLPGCVLLEMDLFAGLITEGESGLRLHADFLCEEGDRVSSK